MDDELEFNKLYMLPNGSCVAFRAITIGGVEGISAVFQLKDKTVFQCLQERLPEHLMRINGGLGNARGELTKTKFDRDGMRRIEDKTKQVGHDTKQT